MPGRRHGLAALALVVVLAAPHVAHAVPCSSAQPIDVCIDQVIEDSSVAATAVEEAVSLSLKQASGRHVVDAIAKLEAMVVADAQADPPVAAERTNKIAKLQEVLAAYRAALVAKARADTFAAEECRREIVFCLDRDGAPFLNDETQPVLLVGDSIQVKVLSNTAGDDESHFAVESSGIRRGETLSSGPVEVAVSERDPSDLEFEFRLVRHVELPAITVDLESLEVTVRRLRPDDKSKPRTYTLEIRSRTFYVDWGVVAAFVIEGRRDIMPGGQVAQDMRPSAAFALTWYPAGRTEGRVSYWKYDRKAIARWFGVTLGTDFDFTKKIDEKDYYVGLTISPVAGLGLTVGGAAIQGDFFPTSAAVRDELDPTAEPVVARKYMSRAFIGLFATTDLFRVAMDRADKLRDLLRRDQD